MIDATLAPADFSPRLRLALRAWICLNWPAVSKHQTVCNSMHLKNPTMAYIAESNVEATMIEKFLTARGIPAMAIEDASRIGETLFGPTTLHRPKVYVEKEDVAKVHQFLAEFETRKQERSESQGKAEEIVVTCDSCGKDTSFPGSMKGNAEDCPHCGSFVDVGEPEEWDVGEPDL